MKTKNNKFGKKLYLIQQLVIRLVIVENVFNDVNKCNMLIETFTFFFRNITFRLNKCGIKITKKTLSNNLIKK